MTLAADEFIRRFLLHVLPKGFHRIRHYGLLAGATRKVHLDHARQLLGVAPPPADEPDEPSDIRPPCPCCGGHMIVIETFERWRQPRAPPHGITATGTTTSWLGLTALRKSCASGDEAPRAGDPANRSDDHLEPRSWTPSTRRTAPASHVRTRRCASRRPMRPPHDRAKTEIPIGPRPWPAASCFGGYRSPAGIRYPSHTRTFTLLFLRPNFGRPFIASI